MLNIFEVIDKTGRKIYLEQGEWDHILKHKYMAQYLEDIKETVINPDFIVHHKFDHSRRNYYHYYKERKRYLSVSVKYLNGDGYVVTTFITRKIIRLVKYSP